MGREDGEGGHSIDRQGFGNRGGKRLSKEGDATFSLASRGEELAFEGLVALANEERGGAQASATSSTCIDLVVEQFLDVIDGEEMFPVHGDDDGIPNLRDQDLKGCYEGTDP